MKKFVIVLAVFLSQISLANSGVDSGPRLQKYFNGQLFNQIYLSYTKISPDSKHLGEIIVENPKLAFGQDNATAYFEAWAGQVGACWLLGYKYFSYTAADLANFTKKDKNTELIVRTVGADNMYNFDKFATEGVSFLVSPRNPSKYPGQFDYFKRISCMHKMPAPEDFFKDSSRRYGISAPAAPTKNKGFFHKLVGYFN